MGARFPLLSFLSLAALFMFVHVPFLDHARQPPGQIYTGRQTNGGDDAFGFD